jgi:hypothetical protein
MKSISVNEITTFPMKVKSLIIVFMACLSFFLGESRLSGQSIDQQEVVTMLRDFYTSYINQYSFETNTRTLELNTSNLRKKYCTASLLDKINKETEAENLDFDPFLNAQDANADAIKTLTFVADQSNGNLYVVSYIEPYSKTKISIKLTVVKTTDGLKINSVL